MSNYEKQNFVSGQILKADHLNHMEDGISTLSEEIDDLKASGGISGETTTTSGVVVNMESAVESTLTVSADTTEEVTLYHAGDSLLYIPNSPEATLNGTTCKFNADGTATFSGTPSKTTNFNPMILGSEMYLPAGDYTLYAYNWPVSVDDAPQIVFQVYESGGNYKAGLSVPNHIVNFTLDEGTNVNYAYGVRSVFTGEETTVGVRLVRGKFTTAADYALPSLEKITGTLPMTLPAYDGTNTLWADSGDTLNVQMTASMRGMIESVVDKYLTTDYDAFGLPVLRLDGDTSLMTKDNAVDLAYTFDHFGIAGTLSCKWQGSSSINYDKKNYTLKFDQAFEAKTGWGAQKKYCAKANYIDFSHSRNVVTAKLWGQMVASRNPANDALAACPNYGAVDGFPILIAINDEFAGVYTFNIPKDGWMLNMGDGDNEAILCADLNSPANNFKAEAVVGADKTDFELEYVSDESNTAWVQTSLNNLINACIASDGTDLDTTIAPMLDWDSAIDYTILCALIDHRDGVGKNYLLHTWDGVKWYFDAYDMDAIFGNKHDGKYFFPAAQNIGVRFAYLKNTHRLAELIMRYKLDALKARYKTLRASVLSEDNVATMFVNFAAQIPLAALVEDNRIWPTVPSTNVSNVHQIIDWYRRRVQMIDAEVEAM